MIDTVLFDMGGTLEELSVDEDSRARAAAAALQILRGHGLPVSDTVDAALKKLDAGWNRYDKYRTSTNRELKPDEIWGEYVLTDFGLSRNAVAPFAEELAHMWEVTYYHRRLRPRVAEMLEGLRSLDIKLGVVSNTASLYQVFEILEQYGIRDYFRDVTLSSVTGYRKPDENIFKIALCQVRSDPSACAYAGDTYSRDILGARRAGFGMTFHIHSFLTNLKDAGVERAEAATYTVEDIYDICSILRELRERGDA